MATASTTALIDALRQYRLLESASLEELTALQERWPHPNTLAVELIRRGWLTAYQGQQLLQGRGRELLLGSYVLLDRLGEGGMGTVFKARNWKLGRLVAVKLIRKERLANPDAIRRFQREVRAAAALSHPNIVHAIDADEIAGTHLLVMECVEGATDLNQLVKQHGPLPVAQACDYIRQAALGLQHAHERGLVHRDIKPANLLLTGDGQTVKVLDMGLARLDAPAGAERYSTMTKEGTFMGTADYAAPEQAQSSHTVDIRADLYSLGCTFYYLLTGKVPFPGGAVVDKLLKHRLEEPAAVEVLRPDVAPAVAVVRRLMAKKPAERFQTPAEAAEALAAITIAGETTQAVRTVAERRRAAAPPSPFAGLGLESTETPGAPPRSRRRWLVLGATGGGVALVGLVVLLLLAWQQPAQGPPETPEERPATAGAPAAKAPQQVDDAWLTKVAALPAEKQVQAVAAKLKELNAGFDGKETHKIDNGVVAELTFVTDNVTDISPVRALAGLRTLICRGTNAWSGRLADLTPLKGMKLTSLDCLGTQVADLSPLTGMLLENLNCPYTRVSDLAPLKGIPLSTLNCEGTPVADLTPLKDMKLGYLNIAGTKVADLSPLKGMRLTTLDCHSTKVADLTPLKGMPLTTLGCEDTRVLELAPLKDTKLNLLYIGRTKVSDLSPLKGMPLTTLHCHTTHVSDLSPLKGMPLTELNCYGTPVADLTPLQGMKLTYLDLRHTAVSDLSPLKGMPLTTLDCEGAPVSELSPLKGMKLTDLRFPGTKVADLTPLKGMPLTILDCRYTPVSDFSALKDMKLTSLECGGTKVSDLSPLKGMPLITLSCYNTPVADLSPLAGLKLTTLDCIGTKVSDLSPLKGMPLTTLHCMGTKVSELAPLKGMPLTTLSCEGTAVSDLSPLKGMKLINLNCERTKVSDLSPLKDMPLKELRCDFKPERDAELLRSLKALETINRKPVREFWNDVDKKKP